MPAVHKPISYVFTITCNRLVTEQEQGHRIWDQDQDRMFQSRDRSRDQDYTPVITDVFQDCNKPVGLPCLFRHLSADRQRVTGHHGGGICG